MKKKTNKKGKNINMSVVPFRFSGYRTLEMHRYMLQDSIRTDSFRKAILKVVKKGDVVVDLGAGSGILSFFAYQAGAKIIFAIEKGDIIEVAKRIARRNRMDHKIVFINEDSRTTNLPDKVDVIVSECIGPYVFGGNMISAVTHMRDRFLKKGGVIIPNHVSMFLVPVQSFSHYEYVNYWERNISYGIDLSPAQKMANNNVYLTTMDARNFISDPKNIATVNLSQDHPNEMLNIKINFPVKKPCSMHGLCGWFDVNLCNGVSFSASPLDKTTLWQQVFFPMQEEILLEKGSVVTVDLVLKRSEDNLCSCFNWTTTVVYPGGRKQRLVKRQSTKKSFPFDYQEICKIKRCDVGIDGKIRNRKLEEIAKHMKTLEYKKKLKELIAFLSST